MSKTVTILGQGYVGLPLAEAAVSSGWRVWGMDLSVPLVDDLNSGVSHVDDVPNERLREMLESGYSATTDARRIGESDVVVVCVPTPLGDAGGPDLSAVDAAARTIGDHLTPGTTVILESTTYPGTTEELFGPLIESGSGLTAGHDFHLAFSPERVDPGNARFGIRNTPKLIGGISPESAAAARAFYSDFVEQVHELSGTREAETAKLLENTFRHVNIALVNEMAKFSTELGIDIWEVIRGASTKPFGFMPFRPGPGVGGHCIPIDPNYLSYEVRKELGYPFRFVELAQEINSSMPRHVVSRVADLLNDRGRAVRGSKVLLLGITYKPDVPDLRESPAIAVAEGLLAKGAQVNFYDPFVSTWTLGGDKLDRSEDLRQALKDCDVAVLLQAHSAFQIDEIEATAPVLFDTQGVSKNSVRL